MRLKLTAAAISSAVLLAGCASKPSEIGAASVSSIQFNNHTCTQLGMESERISTRINELYASLDKKATNDAVAMGVGMLVFWPALFFLEGGDGPEAQEYAHLKGEYNAVEKVAIKKECTVQLAQLKTPEEYDAERKAKAEATE